MIVAEEIVCHDLGSVEQIPRGEGRQLRVGALLLAVFRTREGGLFATQALCPHRGGPLADGIVGGGQVICPLHGYRFDLATGQSIGSDCQPLQTYRVHVDERGNMVLSLPVQTARQRATLK